jgi:hypothetical protein
MSERLINPKPINPSAFPIPDGSLGDGMSLRDYFAAAALTGLLANPEFEDTAHDTAKIAYQQADAMLLERAK